MDPSDIYRPDLPSFAHKDVENFRDFTVNEDDPMSKRIHQTYLNMHTNQTVDFVKGNKLLLITFILGEINKNDYQKINYLQILIYQKVVTRFGLNSIISKQRK